MLGPDSIAVLCKDRAAIAGLLPRQSLLFLKALSFITRTEEHSLPRHKQPSLMYITYVMQTVIFFLDVNSVF